jgi:hypothetical protein
MSQQSRGQQPFIKQEYNGNHVNPQMLFQQQQQQQQRQQQQQQQQQRQTQQQQQTPMMFMHQPGSSSALQHQYINDDSLAGSSTFGDNELAESLGYGNINDPFQYTNNLNGLEGGGNFGDNNGINSAPATNTGGKSFPMRFQQGNNNLFAASPSDFNSFSPDFGSPPIPFNRARGGQMTSMSLPQYGNNAIQNHAAMVIGHGSLTASPSTPGFVASFGGSSYHEELDAAKYFVSCKS